ncbi:WD40 repeat domain-containing protein [Nonomuraea angiospora]|uniref:WD40 repeat domain-containing protein n=1 Tax=Nonomuraea angiospora TaxID=46172 RepID=UPI003430AC5E
MHLPHADRTRWFLAVLLVLAVSAWGIAVEAGERHDVERVALARKLALKGAELRELDAGDAVWLGAAAVRLHADAQTRDALADTLANDGLLDLNDVSRADEVAMTSDGSLVLALPIHQKAHWWELPREHTEMNVLDAGVLDLKGSAVDEMAMSADGATIVTADDYEGLTVWDLDDRAHSRKVAFLSRVESFDEIVLSGDGTTALVAYDDMREDLDAVTVEVWDLRRRSHPARRSTLKVPSDFLYGMAISADGKTAVAVRGHEGGWLVWDLTDPAHPVELHVNDQGEESVALSPDGRRAVFGTGRGADVWDLSDRTKPVRVATMGGDFHDVFAVAMARKGELALTADYHGRAVLWDLSDPSRPVRLAGLKTGGRAVHAVALSDDGRTAVMGSPWGGPRIWDLSRVDRDPLRSFCRREDDAILGEFWERYTDGQGSAYVDGDGDFQPCDGVLAR